MRVSLPPPPARVAIFCRVKEDGADTSGLVAGTVCVVLAVVSAGGFHLVRVSDPGGQCRWLGAWGPKSSAWSQKMKFLVRPRFSDLSTFFMSFANFLDNFTDIHVVHLARGWYHACLERQVQHTKLLYEQTQQVDNGGASRKAADSPSPFPALVSQCVDIELERPGALVLSVYADTRVNAPGAVTVVRHFSDAPAKPIKSAEPSLGALRLELLSLGHGSAPTPRHIRSTAFANGNAHHMPVQLAAGRFLLVIHRAPETTGSGTGAAATVPAPCIAVVYSAQPVRLRSPALSRKELHELRVAAFKTVVQAQGLARPCSNRPNVPIDQLAMATGGCHLALFRNKSKDWVFHCRASTERPGVALLDDNGLVMLTGRADDGLPSRLSSRTASTASTQSVGGGQGAADSNNRHTDSLARVSNDPSFNPSAADLAGRLTPTVARRRRGVSAGGSSRASGDSSADEQRAVRFVLAPQEQHLVVTDALVLGAQLQPPKSKQVLLRAIGAERLPAWRKKTERRGRVAVNIAPGLVITTLDTGSGSCWLYENTSSNLVLHETVTFTLRNMEIVGAPGITARRIRLEPNRSLFFCINATAPGWSFSSERDFSVTNVGTPAPEPEVLSV